jgi:hypothetical protein
MNVHDNAALLWSILTAQGGVIGFAAWREMSGLAPASFLAAFNILGRQQLIVPGNVGETLEDGTWVAVRDDDEVGH